MLSGGYCIFVILERLNWTAASNYCRQQQGFFADIHLEEEMKVVSKILLPGYDSAWVGLNDIVKEGTWVLDKYNNSLAPAYRVPWAKHQPDNYGGNEDCGEIILKQGAHYGQINDVYCGAKRVAVCKKVLHCPHIVDPENGYLTGNATSYGSLLTFQCNLGYTLNGFQLLICGPNGKWNGRRPTCLAVTCPPLSTPKNGAMNSTNASYRSVRSFNCSTGYRLIGSSTRMCQANRTWNGKETTCVAVTCPSLPTPKNGAMNSTNASYRSVRSFNCSSGYGLIGSSTRMCQANRTWDGMEATCVAVTCPPLSTPKNGAMNSMNASYGSVRSFNCSAGYQLIGSSTRMCQANRTWDGMETTCVASGQRTLSKASVIGALIGGLIFVAAVAAMIFFIRRTQTYHLADVHEWTRNVQNKPTIIMGNETEQDMGGISHREKMYATMVPNKGIGNSIYRTCQKTKTSRENTLGPNPMTTFQNVHEDTVPI